jgi:hypothetical protein
MKNLIIEAVSFVLTILIGTYLFLSFYVGLFGPIT